MPYISNKERAKTIKKINKGNGGKKSLVTVTLFLWVAIVAFFIISSYLYSSDPDKFWFFSWVMNETYSQKINTNAWSINMSPYGVCMMCGGVILLALTVLSTIVVWCFPSPANVTKKVNKLASSAISGKKSDRNSTKNVKERFTNSSK